MRAAALTLSLLLAGCAVDDRAVSGSLWYTEWVAESLAGKPVTPPGAITLRFETGTATGNSGCNSYRVSVTQDGTRVIFGDVASTMMACVDDGRMQQEATYARLLKSAARFERPTPLRLEIVALDGRRIVFAAKR